MSYHVDKEDSDSRSSGTKRSGAQPESEEEGEVGGVWIVGNVEELIEEEAEGTSRPGCRSKYWAGEEQRDELSVIRHVGHNFFRRNLLTVFEIFHRASVHA